VRVHGGLDLFDALNLDGTVNCISSAVVCSITRVLVLSAMAGISSISIWALTTRSGGNGISSDAESRMSQYILV
jgi:hypothetical protein